MIDTAAKRFSAINVSCPWRGVSVLPDGTIGQGDRQAAAFLYSGIAAGGAAPADARNPFIGFIVNISLFMNR